MNRPSSFESPDDDPEGRYNESPPDDAIETCECCEGHSIVIEECDCDDGDCGRCVWGYRWFECQECGGKGKWVMPYREYRRWKREDV